jgi:hypothetical protein
MRPEAKSNDLLYVSDVQDVLVFSYPQAKLVGTLGNFQAPYYPRGLCSDKHSNVFFVGQGSVSKSLIYEYAHGGSAPIKTLTDPGLANGCATDPETGDLAVTNQLSPGSNEDGNVAIYKAARGTPTIYSDSSFPGFYFCAYDNSGNLFADFPGYNANVIAELPKDGDALTDITLTKEINPASIQWHGDSFVVGGGCCGNRGTMPVYQVQVSGSTGTVTGPTQLWSQGDRKRLANQLLNQANLIVGPDFANGKRGVLNFWKYPEGGKPQRVVRPEGAAEMFGIAFSAAE